MVELINMNRDILKFFKAFIGDKVLIDKSYKEYNSEALGLRLYSQYELSKKDLTVAKIKSLADYYELKFRLWLPMSIGTMDFVNDRLNVHVQQKDDTEEYYIKEINLG